MIIKSMSRETMSFHQLINYLDKEDVQARFSWNMYARNSFQKELIREFMANAKNLKSSRGKVYLYHEIISLENINLESNRAQEIFYDLASEYINARAKNHLVFGAIHSDTNNPHIHLVISANEVNGSKRVRLSKKEFSVIQADLEEYKNKKYASELGISHRYSKAKDRQKAKQSEQEIKHRRKKMTKKEKIKEDLRKIFSNALSQKALENSLKNRGYELYVRGSTIGVLYEGKKYRLKTLGVDSDYKQALSNIQKREARQEKRQEFKDSKNRFSSKSRFNEQSFSR